MTKQITPGDITDAMVDAVASQGTVPCDGDSSEALRKIIARSVNAWLASNPACAAAPAMSLVLEAIQLGIARIEGSEFCFNGLRFSVRNGDWDSTVAVAGRDRLTDAIAKAKGIES